jgi:antitoxin HicB
MSDKNLEYYMSLPYTITIIPDTVSGGYVAKINELTGCLTQGETLDEVTQMIEDAKRGWLEIALEEGLEIPEPVNDQYSGKFNVRVPRSLHRILVEKAKEENVSLNQYVNYQLARGTAFYPDTKETNQ